MSGHAAAIFRHPVKGFTPEALDFVELSPGKGVAFDRVYAVENGPSGFDPAAPTFIPKQKFTVLAQLPRIAAARTRFHEADATLQAAAPGAPPFRASLATVEGRSAFAAWLTALLGDEVRGPLKVVEASDGWRFFDNPQGHVSLINLASLRDLGQRMGVELDPLRFRANVYVEGWPAWAENQWAGKRLMLGWARAEVFKPIVRCAAVHVDPTTGERDLDVTKALFDNYGHMLCGTYVNVTHAGRLGLGDAIIAPDAEAHTEDAEWG
jgi:uncharacterized protein YcbX